VEVDLAQLVGWKSSIVKNLTGGIGQLLKANGVTVFKGLGTLTGFSADKTFKKIRVDSAVDSYALGKGEGTTTTEILGERVILATGSQVVQIPTLPFDGKTILGSKDALEVEKTPKKIAVVGGGFIGLEIGTFYAKLGVDVTVVEATATLLPGTDRECVDVVAKKLAKKGVKVLLNAKAQSFDKKNSQLVIEHEGTQKQIPCEWILVTVGRKPRTGGLGLENIGLKTDAKGFLSVDDRLETAVPGIFAIGDVIGGPMLAHKASKEGLVAVEGFKNPQARMDVRALPWAIFVDPEIATVGHTEESARAAGWDPVVGKCPFVANGRALTTGEAEGFVKIIADRKTDRVLGAHMVGPDVSNLIQEVATIIEFGGTAKDLASIIHSHPTLPETIMEAAESVHGMAVHFFEKKAKSHSAQPQI
jgi:dihydrolipoamide dehydrogenase